MPVEQWNESGRVWEEDHGLLDEEQVAWVRGHHECWNGTGDPDGLTGDEIPDGAQVLAVADAWDAIPGAGVDFANKMMKPVTNFWTTYRQLWQGVLEGKDSSVGDRQRVIQEKRRGFGSSPSPDNLPAGWSERSASADTAG